MKRLEYKGGAQWNKSIVLRKYKKMGISTCSTGYGFSSRRTTLKSLGLGLLDVLSTIVLMASIVAITALITFKIGA